ncbi:hypothetical protein HPB52_001662 [Rhipicephalus sanguineus]|uniref:Uncharacterized protein n=1 Tax=Rhipicephalus sanguineus TaxID=34632 RepID=A0A9D4Q4C5_RHISA|nr:hypothetical protein HPB52_001662 [Rhipicephalus sanguineus]
MDAIGANLARSRELTVKDVGGDDIAVMYDDEPESWCKHERARALGEPAPAHTPLLTKAQGKAIFPIYKRLTDEKLLTRCTADGIVEGIKRTFQEFKINLSNMVSIETNNASIMTGVKNRVADAGRKGSLKPQPRRTRTMRCTTLELGSLQFFNEDTCRHTALVVVQHPSSDHQLPTRPLLSSSQWVWTDDKVAVT